MKKKQKKITCRECEFFVKKEYLLYLCKLDPHSLKRISEVNKKKICPLLNMKNDKKQIKIKEYKKSLLENL